MRKKCLCITALVCAALYLVIAASAIYRIHSLSARYDKKAREEFAVLVDHVSAAAVFGFMGDTFRNAVRDEILGAKALAAVTISGPSGLEYAFERASGYLTEGEDGPRFSQQLSVSSNTLFSPLKYDGVRNATISASYLRYDLPSLYIILRDSLILCLVTVALGILILVITSLNKSKGKEPATQELFTTGTTPTEQDHGIPDIALEIKESVISPDFTEPQGLYAPESQIGWEEYLADRLASELHRCASFDQDLSLLFFATKSSSPAWKTKYREFAEMAVNYFSFRDLVFERGETGLSIILPNVDLEHSISMAEEFLTKVHKRDDFSELEVSTNSLRCGISSRTGRLVDTRRMILEANRALEKALEETATQVIAFKSDPERYRAYIASNT